MRTGALRALATLAALLLAACASPPYQARDWSDYKGEGAEYFQKEEVVFPRARRATLRSRR